MQRGLHMPGKVTRGYLFPCCGWSGCPGGVKQRTEHVAREQGEGLMGAALVQGTVLATCSWTNAGRSGLGEVPSDSGNLFL